MPRFSLLPTDRTSGDILLINADFSRNLLGAGSEAVGQLGLTRLATYLDAAGFAPAILDTGGLQPGEAPVAEFVAECVRLAAEFRVVGFHLTSWNISTTIEVVKALPRETRLLFGGPLASGAPAATLQVFTNLGCTTLGLVQGYGELLTREALKQHDWTTIAGLWTPSTRGALQRPSSAEINTWPLLDLRYASFVQKIYQPTLTAGELTVPQGTVFQAFGLDVNHGCPFDCTYCSLPAFGRSISCYTPERVAREVDAIAREAGIFLFTFTNSNLLFLSRDWLLSLLTEFEKIGIPEYASWTGYHHPLTANLLSIADLRRLKACGCHELVIGVQSVDPQVVQLFHRPANSWEVLREIREKTRAAGLDLVVDYITGVPGEDLSIIQNFYQWCETESVECRSFQLKVYPGTFLARIAASWSATHDLVPVTGELAPLLESYAVLPKQPLPNTFVAAEERLRAHNERLVRERPTRIGQVEIKTPADAKKLLDELPWQTRIPAKVRTMQMLLLRSMLTGGAGIPDATHGAPNPEQMLRTIVLADDSASPIVRTMQARFRKELGEKKFAELRARLYAEQESAKRNT